MTMNKQENDSLGLYELNSVQQILDFINNMGFEFELHEQILIFDRLIELIKEQGISVDSLVQGKPSDKAGVSNEEVLKM